MKEVFQLVLHTHRRNIRSLYGILCIGILDGIATYAIPVTLAYVTKHTATVANTQTIRVLIALYAMSLISAFVIRRYGEYIAIISTEQARLDYFETLLHMPLATIQSKHSGYIIALTQKIADMLPALVFHLFWWATRMFINIISIFILITYTSPAIALVVSLCIVLFVSFSQILSKQMLVHNQYLNDTKAKFSAVYTDTLARIETIHYMHIESFARQRIATLYPFVQSAARAQQYFHARRWAILHVIFGCIYFGIFFTTAQAVAHNILPLSTFIVFVTLTWNLRNDLNQLAENLKTYTELHSYIKQINTLATKSNKAHTHYSVSDHIEIYNGIFQYPMSTMTIRIPELHIVPGSIIGITGSSGEGKSTILKLIGGYEKLSSGILRTVYLLQDTVYIAQEADLFYMTLRENLCLDLAISDDILCEHLVAVGLGELCNDTIHTLDTHVGEKGFKLSAGQKQRINIVRGILQNKPLVLLDEPISHIDTQNTERVVTYLAKYLTGKTAVIVSHQPAVHALCTQMYTIQDHTLSTQRHIHTVI